MMYDIYLAAPFFNKQEWRVTDEIVAVLRKSGLVVFSPKEQHPDGPPDLKNPSVRAVVNDKNLEAMRSSDMCLAWPERCLPERQTVCLMEKTKSRNFEFVKELPSKPDEGTLWEMGYMRALGRHVNIFVVHACTPVNLMMLENCSGFVVGYAELYRAAKHGFAQPHVRHPSEWKGPVR